jgi:tetratricopeptide (TPR) repeat protein
MHHIKYILFFSFIAAFSHQSQAQTAADTAFARKLNDSAEGRMVARDYHGAINLYTLQIKTGLKYGVFWYNRANAESFVLKYPEAIKDYDTALALADTLVMAYMNQAYLYMQLGKEKEAMFDYEKGLKYHKNDSTYQANMHISRGNAYISLNRHAEAEADFTSALKYNPRSGQAWLQRGAVRRKLKKLKLALEDVNKANDRMPHNADVLLLRGIIKFEMQQYKPAVNDLSAAIKIRKTTDAYYYRGQCRMKLGQDSLAREDFTRILAGDKKNIGALNSRAEANFRMKHPQLAIKDYSAVIELIPKSGDAYANRAFVYSMINDQKHACPDWQKAADLGVPQAKEGLKKYCGK